MDTKHPTDIADLSGDELELLAYLLEDEGVELAPAARIPRSTQRDDLPLSLIQERLWFFDQWEPGTPAYNIPFAIELRGHLHVAALEQSLNAIVARHESLRTSFGAIGGRPRQVIAPAMALPLPLIDLRDWPEATRAQECERLMLAESRHSFQLEHGPLTRALLLRLADDRHIFLLTTHHIIFDGWSFGVLVGELATLYRGFCTGQPAQLPELPIQYADFAAWQRQQLQSDALTDDLAYWREQLRGDIPVLELPTDRPRAAVQTTRGAVQGFALDVPLSTALKALSQQEGATLFMTLLAAFQTLLHRYSGQHDLIVGSPIANRDRAELEGLIGFFVTILPLRADLSGNPSFRTLLRQVRERTIAAYAHQQVPFEQLVQELGLQRDPSRPPLFQAMLILHNAPIPAYTLPDLTLTTLPLDNQTAQYDLTLSMQESPEGLVGFLNYNSDLFDKETIARMLGHFQALLAGIASDPDRCLGQLPLLGAAERQQLLAWGGSAPPAPADVCVQQLFEQQAARSPHAPALVAGAQSLSYQELNARANQLAHALRRRGVGPGTPVGLRMERSIELIVSLLAVLKAGGLYVPIDPAYPPERCAVILEDARIALLLTQAGQSGLPASPRPAVLAVDAEWPSIAQEPTDNLAPCNQPDDLAYMIYTSGSSGRPKGVMIPHSALVSYIGSAQSLYQLTPADRVLQFASISFDASAEEIYPCLCCGATLVLRSEEMLRTAATFVQSCQEWRLSAVSLPTAYWHELAASAAEQGLTLPAALRLVIIGGERALPERLAQWHAWARGQVRLVNTYGPTEATIVATAAELRPPASGTLPSAPIGRPLAHTSCYVLDAWQQPVPIGVAGELYIGGTALARGYLDRPDLTAERFVPNPFAAPRDEMWVLQHEAHEEHEEHEGSADSPNQHHAPSSQASRLKPLASRLYRSGDRVRYRPDGNLEFLGRIDAQIKLRGFRIELGEIESVLSSHPALREVVVQAREDTPGELRLVAYVVHTANAGSNDDQQPAAGLTSELRTFLAARLPNYMLPAAYVLLEQLPLTSSGKVDRRALPAPEQRRAEMAQAFVAPETMTEQLLADLWAQLLGVAQVGIYDNFFELGGHSLLATQMLFQLQDALQVALPLRALFEHPTIAELALAIEETLLNEIEDLSDDEAGQLRTALQ